MIHLLAGFALIVSLGQTSPLTASEPILIPGGAGGFDFMNIDQANGLILAAHPKRSGFAVVNFKTGKAKEIDAVAVNGIVADSKGKRVFAAGPDKTLVVFNSTNWHKIGSLSLEGPGDCVQFDTKRGLLYVDNDDGTQLWVVNPNTLAILNSIKIKEAPEYMEIDQSRNRIYQAIKSSNSVQIIDLDAQKVTDEWTLGDLTSPHGLAVDRAMGKVFVAGKNGKLVVLDAMSGKIQTTLDVTKNSDQIAYDSTLHRLYIPGSGQLDIVQVTKDEATLLGSVSVPKACHSITVDSKTHDVWVAYTGDTNSYVMKLSAKF